MQYAPLWDALVLVFYNSLPFPANKIQIVFLNNVWSQLSAVLYIRVEFPCVSCAAPQQSQEINLIFSEKMGGGDFHFKVPDWKTYKVGPHTPELENVQRMLKSLGLKVLFSVRDKLFSWQLYTHRILGCATRFGGLTEELPLVGTGFLSKMNDRRVEEFLLNFVSEYLPWKDCWLGECCQDLALLV